MIETQFWLTSLTVYCSQQQRARILAVSGNINGAVGALVGSAGAGKFVGGGDLGKTLLEKVMEAFSVAYKEIADCAREDLGRNPSRLR